MTLPKDMDATVLVEWAKGGLCGANDEENARRIAALSTEILWLRKEYLGLVGIYRRDMGIDKPIVVTQ